MNLTCERKSTGSLIWIRFVRGHTLEVLGKTYSYEANPRITASEKPGIFVLHIKNANLSDTALYFCLKIRQTVTILNETDLRVEGEYYDQKKIKSAFEVSVYFLTSSKFLRTKTWQDYSSYICTRTLDVPPEHHK